MKKGINYWSFHEGPKLSEAFRMARDAGFDTFEVCLDEEGEVSMDSAERDMKTLAEEAARCGLGLPSVATGLYWEYPLTSEDPAKAEKAKEITRKMIKVASWLGSDTVLVVPGAVSVFFIEDFKTQAYEDVYRRSRAALEELVPAAEEHKVAIGVENVWNKFLLSPLEMRDFIDGFDSPYLGAYFDTGNVLLTGFPEDWIKTLGGRIKKVHAKDYKNKGFDGNQGPVDGFCDLGAGDVDWPAVVSALEEAGYDGPLTAEMVPPTTNISGEGLIGKTSAALDAILGRKKDG